MSPSPTLGSIIKKSKALQVLRVEDHQKTRYKPISFNGTIPQASNTKDKAHKLQKIKPTSSQASKEQAHKLQRYNPTNFKDKIHKLQRIKFTSFKGSNPQASTDPAHSNKLQGFKAQVQNPPSGGP